MADPNVAPVAGSIPKLEGIGTSDPAQGVALHQRTLDPSLNVLRKGRVEDVYMDHNCAVVAVMGYKRNLPCFWLAPLFNRWFGAKHIAPPTVGTEVAVIISNDQKFGVIIGAINAAGEKADRPAGSLFASSVSREGDLEAHIAKDWGWNSILMDLADGVPGDVLPGDSVTTNTHGASQALLELLASMRGGNGASIETFILDQLVRITGYNLQERTALYERNVMEDGGMSSEESSGTHIMEESMGNDPEAEVPEYLASMARRFQTFKGFLGGLSQDFVIRPDSRPADMSKAGEQPDLGLYHRFQHVSGATFERSITGGGFVKAPVIAVPKKKKEVDDPSGSIGKPLNDPSDPFTFDEKTPGTPAGSFCQIRDFLAWQFNRLAMARINERSGDWVIPEEEECPSLGESDAPGIGGFYREFPGEVDALKSEAGETTVDPKNGMKARLGSAWCLVLPDGSVSIRDIWGSSINMSGGHIDISASKDVRIVSGGSVVVLGGDDCVIKARQSVDVSASIGQVRVRSHGEVFISSAVGGMLINLESAGRVFSSDKRGEQIGLSGLVIKSTLGGVTINSNQLTVNSNALFLNSMKEGGPAPIFMGKVSGMYLQVESGGVAFLFKNGGTGISDDGYIFTTGHIYSEKNLYAKGGAILGGSLSENGDFSEVEPIQPIIEEVFENIDDFQWQYSLENLAQVRFGFRQTSDYATTDGIWFESFWQRETEGLDPWVENPDETGEYPYPGKDHFIGGRKSFWKYVEANVGKNGVSYKRDRLSPKPPGFKGGSFSDFLVHPPR